MRFLSILSLIFVLAGTVHADAVEETESALERAYQNYRELNEGQTAQYIPALTAANPEDFGLVIALVDGTVIKRGDSDKVFAIMSAAKPFTLALLLQQRGPEYVVENIGVEPTGLPFNALSNISSPHSHTMNPLVNAGAITTVSHLQVKQTEQHWPMLLNWYEQFAGEPLEVIQEVYQSVSKTNYRNRALLNLLQVEGWLLADPVITMDVYNKQSSIGVTATQLATMGATLANGGIQPTTGQRILAEEVVTKVLAMMSMNGFYDESGWWAYTTGLPAKSGVGGGIIAIVPGKMAIASYSPRLNQAGNSVRGLRALQWLSQELKLNVFQP